MPRPPNVLILGHKQEVHVDLSNTYRSQPVSWPRRSSVVLYRPDERISISLAASTSRSRYLETLAASDISVIASSSSLRTIFVRMLAAEEAGLLQPLIAHQTAEAEYSFEGAGEHFTKAFTAFT